MAQNRGPGVEPGSFLEQFGQDVADPSELHMSEGINRLGGLLDGRRQQGAFGLEATCVAHVVADSGQPCDRALAVPLDRAHPGQPAHDTGLRDDSILAGRRQGPGRDRRDKRVASARAFVFGSGDRDPILAHDIGPSPSQQP